MKDKNKITQQEIDAVNSLTDEQRVILVRLGNLVDHAIPNVKGFFEIILFVNRGVVKVYNIKNSVLARRIEIIQENEDPSANYIQRVFDGETIKVSKEKPNYLG